MHAELREHAAFYLTGRRSGTEPDPVEELGMRPLLAHCHLGLGTLYATLGRRDTARTALAAAIDLYRAMDMPFWRPQAEALLAQVE